MGLLLILIDMGDNAVLRHPASVFRRVVDISLHILGYRRFIADNKSLGIHGFIHGVGIDSFRLDGRIKHLKSLISHIAQQKTGHEEGENLFDKVVHYPLSPSSLRPKYSSIARRAASCSAASSSYSSMYRKRAADMR